MRVLISCVLIGGIATCSALAACGTLLGIDSDPGTPDRIDAEADGAPDGPMTDTGDGAIDDGRAEACAQAAACSPERITTLGGSVVRLVVANGALYAAVLGANKRIYRVASSPPGVSLDLDPQAGIAEQFRLDSNIAVDPSGAVYWGTPNGMRRHEAAAGADASTDAGVTALIDLGAPVAGVRIVAGRLAFAVAGPIGTLPNAGHVASCALPGCSDVQVLFSAPRPSDFMALGAVRYWFGTDDTLLNFGLRTGSNVLIGGEQLLPSPMVGDGQHIYWSTIDGLRMFTAGGSAITELLSTPSAPRVNGIALDTDGMLYLTQGPRVSRCAVGAETCTPQPFATAASTVLDVTIDDTYAYWGTTDGEIFRERKH